jgi:hypothetical protein
VSRRRHSSELLEPASVRLDPALLRRIDTLASETRRTRSQVINALCEAAIDADEKSHAQARDLFTPAPKQPQFSGLSYVERLRLAGGAS